MRLLNAIACECDLDICHFDVDQAFVQSDLEDNVFFLWLPKGCGDLSGKIVRLNKSLYGLKQALRYMACSSNGVSPKTRFRAMYDILCMCFPFDRGWTYDNYSSCARR